MKNRILLVAISLFLYFFLSLFTLQAQYSLNVNHTTDGIVIDGKLESLWKLADSTNSFTQIEPSVNDPSSRETVVKLLQDKSNLYLSFICYLENNEEPAARIQRRDQLDFSDDIISILLDTYNDNRSALLFQVNALGTLSDAKVNDDGRNIDYLWDTEWEAGVSIDDGSWIVEVKIPFKSIQFRPDISTWGCYFSRSIRLNNEISWWSPVTQNFRVSQNGSLKNINIGQQKKHSLILFPYTTLRYANTNIPDIQEGLKGDVGGDLEYRYSSNIKANITVNPDFATVEGDKEQINLTPWELKFPDKRLFFQDGNDMFKTRIQTFYSRRIGDIQYGGKVTGKIDKFQFNGLHARTRGDESLLIPDARFNAFRVKRDILNSSTLGFIYTDKITDTTAIRTYNLDYVLNLGKIWKLTGQFVASTPGDLGSHSAWFVRFARENNIYHYHIRFTSLGRNFQDNVNETGYIPDDDRLEIDSDINYKFWLNRSVQYLYLSGRNNIFWSQEGKLRSWYLTYGARMYLENRFSLDAYYNNEYKLLDKDYYNHFYRFIAGYNTDEASHAQLSYRFGRNFDRDFHLLEFNARFNPWKRFTLNYEFNYLDFTPDATNQSTFLNVVGIDYYFTRDLWIRLFAQNNSTTEKYYFYGLFGWRFKPPFGALYLIVNTDNYFDFDSDSNFYSELVFLKLTYPLVVIRN